MTKQAIVCAIGVIGLLLGYIAFLTYAWDGIIAACRAG